MRKEPITRSPHAFDIMKHLLLSDKEQEELYSQRIDELAQPYTVIDVITKVYQRTFRDDLHYSLTNDPGILQAIKQSSGNSTISQYWINNFKILRPESVFGQPATDFNVDIYAEARIKIIEKHNDGLGMEKVYSVNTKFRLRYCFDLRPCELTCHYVGVVLGDENGIHSIYPDSFRLDKYLLPVLTEKDDYERLARMVIEEDLPDHLDSDKPISGMDWLENIGLSVYSGKFPESGVMGEYYFSFGKAQIYDPETDDVKTQRVNPGTILLNIETCKSKGMINSTAVHEGTHHRLCYYYFMLQMAHGRQYCSYLCKRTSEQQRSEKWSPIDVMELHANKLPAYILIQEKPGKAKAEELMRSYGGAYSLENMIRLVNDIAEYFEVTKTMARSRLFEFGYKEVRGISQYIGGKRVPSHISRLSKNETYTIDENAAINEYMNDPQFRKLINTGLFEYVEGHFCFIDKKYIAIDHLGYKHLTTFAREHMEECCLSFEVKYEKSAATFVGGFLCKSINSKKIVKYTNINGDSLVTAEGLAKRKEIERQIAETELFEKSFNQMTKELMKSRGFTIERLAEETGLSEETIKNMRSDSSIRFSIEAVVAVCIAMHLSEDMSRMYISRSPAKFLGTVDMRLYSYALMQWSDCTVAVVNRKLIEYGAKPLTKLVAGLDVDIFAKPC